MARKLPTKPSRAAYARRKVIVVPVFGQIATLQGKHALLRGLDNARGEWKLLAACHNLRTLYGHNGTAALGSLRPARQPQDPTPNDPRSQTLNDHSTVPQRLNQLPSAS